MNLKNIAIWGAFWKLAERLLAQGITLVVSIVLARLLLPEDYGIVGMVTIFFTFANVLISGGLNTALIQKKNAEPEDYSSVFTVSLIVGFVLYIIMFSCAPFIARCYKQPQLIPVIRVMGLSLPIYAIKSIASAYTSANLLFKKYFFATLGGTLFSGCIGIIMALCGKGVWALVVQQISNTLIDTLILVFVTKLKLKFYISFVRLRSLIDYGWKVFVSSLLATAYTQVNPLVIGIRFSMADLSFYTKGQAFVNTLSSSITYTLSSVLFPVLAKVQDDKEQLLKGLRTYIQLSSFVLFPVMLGFLAVSDTFVNVVLTEKWMPAAFYIKIFCIAFLFDLIAAGNCETIKAMGRSDLFLKMEILKKSLYFVVLFLFILFTHSPRVLVLSELCTAFIALIINMYPNKGLLGYSTKMQINDFGNNLLISMGMCLCVYYGGNYLFTENTVLKLIVQVVSGMVIYVGLNIILRNPSFKICLNLLKGFKEEK